jgi:hypothetical protein
VSINLFVNKQVNPVTLTSLVTDSKEIRRIQLLLYLFSGMRLYRCLRWDNLFSAEENFSSP